MINDLHMINEWVVKKAGDVFMFGAKGSGKSCKLLGITQAMLDNGLIKKVWDIFGGDRDEGPFWSFPNRDFNLWNELESETYELEVEGPKQYKVTLATPLFSKDIPTELPEDMPNVESKVFTIPFREIDKKLIGLVMGEVGKQAETLWEDLLNNTNKNSNGEDLKFLMNNKFKGMKNSSFYKLFLQPLIDNHFLNSENSELNLDLKLEASKTDRVFVLCLDNVPERFKLFVMGYIINKLYNMVRKNQTHKEHFLLFREASKFMKVVDSDKNREAQNNAFRNLLVDMVRYGRTGIFFGLDTQDSSEVKGLIDGQQELLGICELPSPNSIEATCIPLKRAGRMNDAQISYIQWRIQKHQICIIPRGGRAIILKRINPPRSLYWKPEYRNFTAFWKKEKDKWILTKDILEQIKKEYEERRQYLTIINTEEPEEEDEEILEEDSEKEDEEEIIENKGGQEIKLFVPKAVFEDEVQF